MNPETTVRDPSSAFASDLRNVAADAQELLRTIGSEDGASAAAPTPAKVAERYVHEHPWGALAVAATLAAVAGYLLGRR